NPDRRHPVKMSGEPTGRESGPRAFRRLRADDNSSAGRGHFGPDAGSASPGVQDSAGNVLPEDGCVQDPEQNAQMESLDRRAYVGGLWEEIGKLQFEFLLRQGLAPSDCYLDIACGSPRGGVHFVNYLDAGNYLGIEKQRRLVELGIENELGRAVFLKQKPE